MDYKSNKATALRPDGDRTLNAPLVEIDLNKFISQVKSETTWQDSDRNSITVFKSEKKTIVLVGMHAGATMDKHISEGEITIEVLAGRINFESSEKTISLGQGNMIALQAGIEHSVTAGEESFFLLTLITE